MDPNDPQRTPAQRLNEGLNELVAILTEQPTTGARMALDVIAQMREVVNQMGGAL